MPRASALVRSVRCVALALLAVGFAASAFATPTHATGYPALPETGREFLQNLSLPSVAPGGASSLAFVLANPTSFSLSAVVITFGVYAFNGYPGDQVGALPAAAPALDNGTASGAEVNVSVPALAPGASYTGSVRLATSASTPTGTFAVRIALSFTGNATNYRLESRGWFSSALWANATTGPNGSATVNLTKLGVSGVVPETALLVRPSDWPVVLGVLLAVGFVLVGAGAFVYFRRGSARSSSGAG